MEDGKSRIGLVHIMISPSRGFIIQILDGFISVNQQMVASGYGAKVLAGYGAMQKAFLIFSQNLPKIGYISTSKSLKQDNTMTLKIKVGTT